VRESTESLPVSVSTSVSSFQSSKYDSKYEYNDAPHRHNNNAGAVYDNDNDDAPEMNESARASMQSSGDHLNPKTTSNLPDGSESTQGNQLQYSNSLDISGQQVQQDGGQRSGGLFFAGAAAGGMGVRGSYASSAGEDNMFSLQLVGLNRS
jgi:hypothetical protein